MARSMTEVVAGYVQLAQDFADNLREMAPAQASGKIEAAAFSAAPEQVIVVWMPPDAPPHLLADVARFVGAQADVSGVRVPVLVAPAVAVTVEDSPPAPVA